MLNLKPSLWKFDVHSIKIPVALFVFWAVTQWHTQKNVQYMLLWCPSFPLTVGSTRPYKTIGSQQVYTKHPPDTKKKAVRRCQSRLQIRKDHLQRRNNRKLPQVLHPWKIYLGGTYCSFEEMPISKKGRPQKLALQKIGLLGFQLGHIYMGIFWIFQGVGFSATQFLNPKTQSIGWYFPHFHAVLATCLFRKGTNPTLTDLKKKWHKLSTKIDQTFGFLGLFSDPALHGPSIPSTKSSKKSTSPLGG